LNDGELEGLHISQQDQEGNILHKYYARRAVYQPADQTWALKGGKMVRFNLNGEQIEERYFETEVIKGWTETPWRIASADLEAQNLSVPELHDYLRHNSDFPDVQLAPYRTHLQYRWALPWTCLVVVFIASPLGIVFSRRGVLAGVASSIFIFFTMVFLTNLFLALGKGGRVSPVIAAWTPNAIFAAVGLALLYLRSTNREVPKLIPWGK
jgi:lipopolysaccharide export system permease protein